MYTYVDILYLRLKTESFFHKLKKMDVVLATISSTLWITEQVFSLVLPTLELLFSTVIQLVNISQFLVFSVFSNLVFAVYNVLLFANEHLYTVMVTTLDMCFNLFFIGWSHFTCFSRLVCSIGWEGVYTLFIFVYGGLNIAFSLLFNCAKVLFQFSREFDVDNLKFDSFYDALVLWKTVMINVVYISIGLVLVTWFYLFLKLLIPKLVKLIKQENQPPQSTRAQPSSQLPNETVASRLRRRMLDTRINSPNVTESSSAKNVLDTGLKQEVSRLNAELTEEKDKHLCVVCLEKKREVLLKPCKHYCLCRSCLPKLHCCPICNQRISSSEKIYHV